MEYIYINVNSLQKIKKKCCRKLNALLFEGVGVGVSVLQATFIGGLKKSQYLAGGVRIGHFVALIF